MLSILCVAALAICVSGSPARVAGGAETTVERYPYAAALLYSADELVQQHLGTATIINNRSVLTLASWIYDTNRAREWHLRTGSSSANSGGSVYDVDTVVLHPRWSYEPLTADLAVLRIATAFAFGFSVQPTAIAGPAYILPDGTDVSTIGWGQTYAGSERSEQLRDAEVQIISRDACVGAWAAEGVALAEDMMCAADVEGGRGLCTWDFGGPLLHGDVVIGVASHSQLCGEGPGLYTRVSDHTEWIVLNA